MSLEERLIADMKDAMRGREEVRVSAIRMVRAALANEAIDKRRPLSEEEAVAVLSRQVKQRRESIEAFSAGNRQDLVDREQQELDVLLAYMPQQMTQDEIVQAAKATIQEVGATGPTDFGKVMSRLAPALKGKADGKLIGDVVRKLLSGQESA
ncbi:MAG: GatB/YqeY domain-containing protein [Planctomycetaceae bacterium]|nr:MAG: GatB/YqeY domain-containing protein [Planctomycetaceae bacterium]